MSLESIIALILYGSRAAAPEKGETAMSQITFTRESGKNAKTLPLRFAHHPPRRGKTLHRVLAISVIFLLILTTVGVGKINVGGSQAQRNKLARWLSYSLGTKVTIANDGALSVAAGGNASATRLRNMANDPNVSVTLEVVDANSRVFFGRWNSQDPNNPYGKTTGTQTVDINDLEQIGNVLNSYGFTPDLVLMHEIAEVYEGKKNHGACWAYQQSHTRGGIAAENELMGEHGTQTINRFIQDPNGMYLLKIKRPDGSHVVVGFDPWAADPNNLVRWFKERVDCNTVEGLIAIADPDPQVHLLMFDPDGDPYFIKPVDTENSMPTGVAFDPLLGDLYVAEDLADMDEVRVFDSMGHHFGTITAPELIDPKGIDVDPVSGDVFVAVRGGILRYDFFWTYLGSYHSPDEDFTPTDVAVWRNDGVLPCLYGEGDIYDIFVTDSLTNQVYRFDVEEDMHAGTHRLAFGRPHLSAPEGLTVGPYDAVWVASTGNDRIYSFTPTGELITHSGVDYFLEDADRNFYDLAVVDGDGVYVVDETPQEGAILLYDFQAQHLATYGQGQVQCPRSIATQFRINWYNLEPFRKSADFNRDGDIDFIDFSYLGSCWLSSYDVDIDPHGCELVDTAPPPFGDLAVTCEDLEFFVTNWLVEPGPSGSVCFLDFEAFLMCWGLPAVGNCVGADWNCDKSVDDDDMAMFLEVCDIPLPDK
jgi:DNA-binding beta-propeller fold protein YncE